MMTDQHAKSKLRYSNPVRNASVLNEGRSSNGGRIMESFQFIGYPLKLWSYWTDVRHIFIRCRCVTVAINPCIQKAILHFILECQIKE